MMNKKLIKRGGLPAIILILLMFSAPAFTQAGNGPLGFGEISGITGPSFNLTAKADYISVPDGNSIYMWGYTAGSTMQYPGPTLIVFEEDDVTVTLTNELPVPTSIVFPGHNVTTSGGSQGLLTAEAAAGGGTVTYSFKATHPGTYTYYSGTRMDLQVEMGLMGVIIVRPKVFDPLHPTAYGTTESAYDVEYLEVLDDIDHTIHDMVEAGNMDDVDTNTNNPVYWFLNGRAFPDTIDFDNVAWLPTQPYGTLTLMFVGQKVLVRVVGSGSDLHPQHFHGNNGKIIARDGRHLVNTSGDGLFEDVNTIEATPGQTVDMIWTWTGQDMDWDFYGHSLSDGMRKGEILASTTLAGGGISTAATSLTIAGAGWSPAPGETELLVDDGKVPSTYKINAIIYDSIYTYPNEDSEAEMVTLKSTGGSTYSVERGTDGTSAKAWGAGSKIAYTEHGRPFRVTLPELQDLTFGGAYHGSPFLGQPGVLPPGEGGLNPFNAFGHPWHNHHEKEIVNNDIFIGGIVTVILMLDPGDI
jgi:manganese oxidase